MAHLLASDLTVQTQLLMERAHSLRILAERHRRAGAAHPYERDCEARAWEQQARQLEAAVARLDAAVPVIEIAGCIGADVDRLAAALTVLCRKTGHAWDWTTDGVLRIVPLAED